MPLAGPPSPPATISKPTILHLGDPILYSQNTYHRLESQFQFINPPASDLHRLAFIDHLRKRTWGDFSAIMRPFWNTGGEMGKWDKEVIELLPETVKVYASAGAGYDWVDTQALADRGTQQYPSTCGNVPLFVHVLSTDMTEFSKLTCLLGILYCNARGASTEAVAIMALYHIISVFRNMTESHLSARSLNPDMFQHAHLNLPLTSHNPRGHTLGIIGLGDIGFAIAKKAHIALGMKIVYQDIVRKSISQEQEVNATYFASLEEMLGQSDCVLVAAPFTGETIITASVLAKFKPGSRLVNIARGSLIDEIALADALDSNHLSGAGLDVHANEPHVNERLANNWKVGMTSHTGGGALETWIEFERLAMENVERVLTGREALTGVNGHLIRREEPYAGLVNGYSSTDETTSRSHPVMNGQQHAPSLPLTNGTIDRSAGANTDMHRQTGIIGGV
ncbi:2-hydroxyacid dehydrogenase UNK4.10 [Physcia stellaris]|nr:2-hydroxyacid dehydrogenase UNK4.10 [Physcia stellaris]